MISSKKYNNGKLWIKSNNEELPHNSAALSSIFLKYAGTSFFNDITSNTVKQICSFSDSILIQTPNGLSIEKLVDIGTKPYDESNNLTLCNSAYYCQWWWSPKFSEVYYVVLSPNLYLSWHRFDTTNNTTQTLLTSSLTAYISGTPNGISVGFNETTDNFNISFSYETNILSGLASMIFPKQSSKLWQLDVNKIAQFSIQR